MTEHQMNNIDINDHVEAYIALDWRRCAVVGLHRTSDGAGHWKTHCVDVRRLGKTANGRAYGPVRRWPGELRTARFADPADGNVFADWLEDNGEPQAAAKLRAAFPVVSEVPA